MVTSERKLSIVACIAATASLAAGCSAKCASTPAVNTPAPATTTVYVTVPVEPPTSQPSSGPQRLPQTSQQAVRPTILIPEKGVVGVVKAPGKTTLQCDRLYGVGPIVLSVGTQQGIGWNTITSRRAPLGVEVFSSNFMPGSALMVGGKRAAAIPSEFLDPSAPGSFKSLLLPSGVWGVIGPKNPLVLCEDLAVWAGNAQ